jgi:hypothetical protein
MQIRILLAQWPSQGELIGISGQDPKTPKVLDAPSALRRLPPAAAASEPPVFSDPPIYHDLSLLSVSAYR